MKNAKAILTGVGLASGIAATLSSPAVGAENPFSIEPIDSTPQGRTAQVEGMCGSRGEGTCGAMMERILPPGQNSETIPQTGSEAARIFSDHCAQCRNLPSPAMHAARDWTPIVDRMQMRMEMMGSMMGSVEELSSEERRILLRYLTEHSQEPIDPAEYPDLTSPAGQSFRNTCESCHALPDPNRHTRSEWPSVVARMQANMEHMGVEQPGEAKLEEVLDFLQRHSKAE